MACPPLYAQHLEQHHAYSRCMINTCSVVLDKSAGITVPLAQKQSPSSLDTVYGSLRGQLGLRPWAEPHFRYFEITDLGKVTCPPKALFDHTQIGIMYQCPGVVVRGLNGQSAKNA